MSNTTPTNAVYLSFAETVWPDVAEMEIMKVQAAGLVVNKSAEWRAEDILDLAERRGLTYDALQAYLVELQTPPSADDEDGYGYA